MNKYLGKKYDAYWVVVDYKKLPDNHLLYKLENDCNKMCFYVRDVELVRIDKRTTNVYKIMRRRYKRHVNTFIGNYEEW